VASGGAFAGPLLLELQLSPVQGWFDEGLAEYFGSIYIGKQVELGGDPELLAEWHEDALDDLECGAIRRYRSR